MLQAVDAARVPQQIGRQTQKRPVAERQLQRGARPDDELTVKSQLQPTVKDQLQPTVKEQLQGRRQEIQQEQSDDSSLSSLGRPAYCGYGETDFEFEPSMYTMSAARLREAHMRRNLRLHQMGLKQRLQQERLHQQVQQERPKQQVQQLRQQVRRESQQEQLHVPRCVSESNGSKQQGMLYTLGFLHMAFKTVCCVFCEIYRGIDRCVSASARP